MSNFELELPFKAPHLTDLRRTVIDMSQDGAVRSRPKKSTYLMLPTTLTMGPINIEDAPMLSGIDWPETIQKRLTDSADAKQFHVRVTYNWLPRPDSATIDEMKRRLRPPPEPANATVHATPEVKEAIEGVLNQRNPLWATIVSAINTYVDMKSPAYVTAAAELSNGTDTKVISTIFSPAVTAERMALIEPFIDKLPEGIQRKYDLFITTLWTAAQWVSRLYVSPVSDVAEKAKVRIMSTLFTGSDWFHDNIAGRDGVPSRDPFSRATLSIAIEEETKTAPPPPPSTTTASAPVTTPMASLSSSSAASATTTPTMSTIVLPTPLDFKDVKLSPEESEYQSMIAEEVFWAFTRTQVKTGSDEQKNNFASTRCIGTRYNWYAMSNEHLEVKEDQRVPYTTAYVDALVDLATQPELYEVAHATSMISFLESGHHATAARVPEKAARIANALGVMKDERRSQQFWNDNQWSMVYHGSHCFDRVLVLSVYKSRAARGLLSYAISRRLVKPAPGTAAYYALSIFVEAMAETPFFKFMDATAELESFRSLMRKIKADNWAKAPYSHYLYGHSVPDDPEAGNTVTRMAAYASAIKDVMPSSTLHMSPSLTRLATSAASNSVAAGLQVGAFVKAYKGVLERTVRARMLGRTSVALVK
jgi:hypothetical protein